MEGHRRSQPTEPKPTNSLQSISTVDDVCRATVNVISSGDEEDLAMLTPFVERLLTRYGDHVEILHRSYVPDDKPGLRLLEIWWVYMGVWVWMDGGCGRKGGGGKVSACVGRIPSLPPSIPSIHPSFIHPSIHPNQNTGSRALRPSASTPATSSPSGYDGSGAGTHARWHDARCTHVSVGRSVGWSARRSKGPLRTHTAFTHIRLIR